MLIRRGHRALASIVACLIASAWLPLAPAAMGSSGPRLVSASAAGSPGTVNGTGTLTVTSTTVNGAPHPLGIDDTRPEFGWVMSAAGRGARQTAYQILVASNAATLAAGEGDVWDSGKVTSADSVNVAYAGPAASSSTRYYWKVRVWDTAGQASAWSAPSWWETGLFTSPDWSGAQWIGGPQPPAPPRWPQGTAASASSYHAPCCNRTYVPGNAIDGDPATFWNDDTIGAYPDVLTIQSPSAVTLPGISLVSHSDGYVVDFTVDTLQGTAWVQQAQVTGNDGVSREVPFPQPVTTSAIRITVTRDQQTPSGEFTRIAEVYPGLYQQQQEQRPAPQLRKDFDVPKPVSSARLYISGIAYYDARLNGERVGDHVLDPGYTRYDKRVQYATYDVTSQVHEGANAIGVTLGRGFYGLTTPDAWNWNSAPWHGQPRLLAELVIDHPDGTRTVVVTDGSWRAHAGPTTSDSIYLGETYDARQETPGWDRAGYDDTAWAPASLLPAPAPAVVAETQPPITVHQVIQAEKVTSPKPGVYVFAFPYVTSGWARLTVSGPAGTDVTLKYGETLRGDGTVNNDNGLVTGEPQTDHYILGDASPQTWHPRFSYKGFQYIEADGYPGTPAADSVQAVSLHTDVAQAGEFSSSSDLLNSIHQITRRSILNNLYGIPTDTPEFEKNGWMGDAQLIAPAAIDNFTMRSFYEKWLYDIQDSQAASGLVPVIAPDDGWGLSDSPAWGAAFTLIPWYAYENYGDTRVLSEHYDAMRHYVDYLAGQTNGTYIAQGGLGDWLCPGCSGNGPEGADLASTAFFYEDARIVSMAAGVLHRDADAQHYAAVADSIASAFNTQFLDASAGTYHTGAPAGYRQTSNVLPLALGITPPGAVSEVVKGLAADIHAHADHLNTGILGTRYLLPVLTEHGDVDLAYQIATQTTYPSWGDWLRQGATTLWEAWSSPRSRDHDMYGSVDAWFYQYLAGIRPASPGYGNISIKPYVPSGLHEASASIDTVRGRVASHWTRDDAGTFTLDVTVPVNATADISVPAVNAWAVYEGQDLAANAAGVQAVKDTGDRVVLTVGSGTYHFRVTPAGTSLGSALDDVQALAGAAASQADLTAAQRSYLAGRAAQFAQHLHDAAADAAVGDETTAGRLAQNTLAEVADSTAWLTRQQAAGELDATAGDQIGQRLQTLSAELSRASALLLDVNVSVATPDQPLTAGDSTRVVVTASNAGSAGIRDVAVTLITPSGWQAVAAGPSEAASLGPGSTLSVPYDVTVPLAQPPGGQQLTARVAYTLASGTAETGAIADLQTVAPLGIEGVTAGTEPFQPGEPAPLTVGIANHSHLQLRGAAAAGSDGGWTVTPATLTLAIDPGGTQQLGLSVTPPADGTPGTTHVRLDLSYAPAGGGPTVTTTYQVTVGDLARAAAASAAHTLESGPWGLAKMVDGQRMSVTGSNGYTSDPCDPGPDSTEWVSVDLGHLGSIGSVTLYPRTHTPADGQAQVDGAGFPKDFQIQVSDDGSAWQTARTVTGQPQPGMSPQTFDLRGTSGRYVRAYVTGLGEPASNDKQIGCYRLQLAELEVNGAAVTN